MGDIVLAAAGALVLTVGVLLFVVVLRMKQARRASRMDGCYFCGSHAVHLSAPNGLFDLLLDNWDCLPHRCEVCFHRYYRFVPQRAHHV